MVALRVQAILPFPDQFADEIKELKNLTVLCTARHSRLVLRDFQAFTSGRIAHRRSPWLFTVGFAWGCGLRGDLRIASEPMKIGEALVGAAGGTVP